MDILIENGVIKSTELLKPKSAKKELVLKKDYDTEYKKGVPGPYYDLKMNHVHVSRKPIHIKNFHGGQNQSKIYLSENKWDNSLNFCCICHQLLSTKVSFTHKRGWSYPVEQENQFARKGDDDLNDISLSLKKIKIDKENIDSINDITIKFSKSNINYLKKWNNLKFKLLKNIKNEHILLMKEKHNMILKKYYNIVYKLVKHPIIYPISPHETRLLWPWELTKYQKFRLEYPNYRDSIIFPEKYCKIDTNYVMIE